MLDLSPERESRLLAYAQVEGVSLDDLIDRHFPPLKAQPQPSATIPLPRSTSTDAEKRAEVLAYIHAPAEEVARLHVPDIAHLQAQLAEAAKATPEEVAQADAEWEEHKRRMNAHRAVTGERAIYADVAPGG